MSKNIELRLRSVFNALTCILISLILIFPEASKGQVVQPQPQDINKSPEINAQHDLKGEVFMKETSEYPKVDPDSRQVQEVKPYSPNTLQSQESEQHPLLSLRAGDPRFGDPITDPEGYAKKKEAFYAKNAHPDVTQSESGEGVTWWTYSDENPAPKVSTTHDEFGKPYSAIQPVQFFGSWVLGSIEATEANSEEEASELIEYMNQFIKTGALLEMHRGLTGFQIREIGITADWWTDQELHMLFFREECAGCDMPKAPQGLVIKEATLNNLVLHYYPDVQEWVEKTQGVRLNFFKSK